jgi:hypothetical protein
MIDVVKKYSNSRTMFSLLCAKPGMTNATQTLTAMIVKLNG